MQDLKRGLAGTLVLVEAVAAGQRDQGLAQRVLMSAVDGVGTAPAGGLARGGEVLVDQCGQ